MVKRKILVIVIIGIVISLILGIGLTGEDFETKKAEDYYKENGVIVSSVKAIDSEYVQTETEVINDMSKRGFDQYPITYNYDMQGRFIKENTASKTKEKHPIYDTTFVTKDGYVWIVTTINGLATAYPLFCPRNSKGVEIIYSEEGTVTSYDAAESEFFITIPDESALDLRKVDRIDAKTLSELTKEVSNEQ